MIVPYSIHRPIQHRNSPYRIGFSPWGRFWLVLGRIVVLMNEEKNSPSNKLRFDGLDNDDIQKVSSGLALSWIVAFHLQMLLWVHKPMMLLVVPGESSVDRRFSGAGSLLLSIMGAATIAPMMSSLPRLPPPPLVQHVLNEQRKLFSIVRDGVRCIFNICRSSTL